MVFPAEEFLQGHAFRFQISAPDWSEPKRFKTWIEATAEKN
jgi:hypothetical protein